MIGLPWQKNSRDPVEELSSAEAHSFAVQKIPGVTGIVFQLGKFHDGQHEVLT
jgi:hypothetical protein